MAKKEPAAAAAPNPAPAQALGVPLAKGARVRVVAPVIEGEVTDRRFNESLCRMEYLVPYIVDGERHERWFVDGQIEEVTA